MRRKRTDLEAEILAQWDELAFRDGGFAAEPCSQEEALRRDRIREGEWQALLDRAFVDGQWILGVSVACALSISIWFNQMILSQYKGAEQAAQRLLEHTDFESASRSDQAAWPIKLYVAQIAQGDLDEPVRNLIAFLQNGPYRPTTMAADICRALSLVVAEMPLEAAINDAMRELAKVIAETKRASQKRVAACAASRTVGEWIEAVDRVF
jgi:hypothetical protein